jgi:hypothetical protein
MCEVQTDDWNGVGAFMVQIEQELLTRSKKVEPQLFEGKWSHE